MKELISLIREALTEDIGQGDVTTEATIPADARCHASLLAKQAGVLSGMKPFSMVFEALNAGIVEWQSLPDGSRFQDGDRLATFRGNTRAILTGERTALNFLQRLSGIATLAAEFRAAVGDLPIRICDTRKTTPGMRKLEKEAVVHGGCVNHRYALFDGVLIKENHIAGAGGVRAALEKAREGTHHLMKIAIEVVDFDQLKEAVEAQADAVLLDNMEPGQIRQAIQIVRTHETQKTIVEVSGNITLNRIRAIAETGADIASVGALTHSASAIDLSLIIRNA